MPGQEDLLLPPRAMANRPASRRKRTRAGADRMGRGGGPPKCGGKDAELEKGPRRPARTPSFFRPGRAMASAGRPSASRGRWPAAGILPDFPASAAGGLTAVNVLMRSGGTEKKSGFARNGVPGRATSSAV
jgi:hypothetical protein